MDWSFPVINANLLVSLFFGALSGYIASRILGRDGYGCLGNIVVGIIGGFIGTWLVGVFKIPMMGGLPGSFISSVGGAIIFIITLDFLSKKSRGSSGRSRSRR
jgi:uncharacterized membrane protein YeaQ/YmgE (transglycosylase-associated protein family)